MKSKVLQASLITTALAPMGMAMAHAINMYREFTSISFLHVGENATI